MRRFLGFGFTASILAGLLIGHAQATSTPLTPAPSNTVHGQSNNVFANSLNGGNGLPATGQVAYPQSFPMAATSTSVPSSISLTSQSISLTVGGAPFVLGTSGPISLSLHPGNLNSLVPLVPQPVQPAPAPAPAVSDYSCATYRPDFRYDSDRLSFAAQSTSGLVQKDMNFWTGLPPGTSRYVPLGEY